MSELSQLKGTFSYDEYKLILEALKTKKTTFEDALKGDFTILRHDVEFNIDRAKKIGVIDSQDAVYGNAAYDLASLVDDVRYKSSKRLKEKIYSEFVNLKGGLLWLLNFLIFPMLMMRLPIKVCPRKLWNIITICTTKPMLIMAIN